jgi:predicted DNA binding CopG/RHH family protein
LAKKQGVGFARLLFIGCHLNDLLYTINRIMTSLSPQKSKKMRGRPKSAAEPQRLLTLRLRASLLDSVETYAAMNGMNRSQAARRLLEIALSKHPGEGYNPRTGGFP